MPLRAHTLGGGGGGSATKVCAGAGVAYLDQKHVYRSLSFSTEAVPPLVPLVHFPVGLWSRLGERRLDSESRVGLFANAHIWPQKQADASSPPSSPLPSLPSLFICCLSTSPRTLPDSRLLSHSSFHRFWPSCERLFVLLFIGHSWTSGRLYYRTVITR